METGPISPSRPYQGPHRAAQDRTTLRTAIQCARSGQTEKHMLQFMKKIRRRTCTFCSRSYPCSLLSTGKSVSRNGAVGDWRKGAFCCGLQCSINHDVHNVRRHALHVPCDASVQRFCLGEDFLSKGSATQSGWTASDRTSSRQPCGGSGTTAPSSAEAPHAGGASRGQHRPSCHYFPEPA